MKKRGFTTLECIVSMMILSMIVYIMAFSINNSFNLIKKDEEFQEMLNLAQNNLNEVKFNIKYGEKYKEGSKIFYVDKFEINQVVIKQQSYYNCYKVMLKVKLPDRSVELQSYVTKK